MAATVQAGFSCCDLERSEAMERYLKAIYLLSFTAPPVSTSQVAARLRVAAPSVSAMLHRLDAAGLLADPGAGATITLSAHGRRHAENVIRRHRLIETFLVASLGMSWDEVHVEAEALEHAVSPKLVDRIDAVLGRPRRDPHGDPIPPPAGTHVESWPPALADAPVGCQFDVARISDEDSAALRYLADLGVRPGVQLRVVAREPFDGPLWVEIDGHRHGLGAGLAGLVHGRARR